MNEEKTVRESTIDTAQSWIILKVSAPNKELADTIAAELVEGHIAASVHIVGPVDTIYWWEGKVHNGHEWLCEARTSVSMKEQAVALIRARHPFRTPEIFSMALQPATPDYEAWLVQYGKDATGSQFVRGSCWIPGGYFQVVVLQTDQFWRYAYTVPATKTKSGQRPLK